MKKQYLCMGAVAGLIAAATAACFAFFLLTLPVYSSAQKIPGISDTVRVYRDTFGVPHIFARDVMDAYTALGFLHAQDRFFQMEMMRRAGTGRLAEVLGKNLVPYDKKMRALGFAQRVEDILQHLSPPARAAMEAYARGVNAYLAAGHLPPEFALLGLKPQVWRASDGLLWAKLMAWQLSGNWEDEIFREDLLKKGWSKENVLTLYPRQDEDVPSVMAPLASAQRKRNDAQGMRPAGLGPEVEEKEKNISFPSSLLPWASAHHTASNAYVISGAHTQSGKPLLANDPHLQLQAPILWYLARIITPDFEIKGASAPGLPFFPLGQTRDVAWGFTTSNMDVADITFIDAGVDAGAADLKTREEIIHVKDGADEKLHIEESENGVVLSGIVPAITDITPPGKKALLQFTGFIKNDSTADALYHINRARNGGDIRDAVKDYVTPPQNLLYADSGGQTGYAAVGLIPQRENDGFYARDNTRWRGMMDAQALPTLQNPNAGVIFSANQAVIDAQHCAAFTCNFARDWSEPYRAMRLEELFSEYFLKNQKLDVGSAAAPMLDIVSLAARRFLPVLLAGAEAKTQDEKDILAALRGWDARMQRDAPEPLMFRAWLDALSRDVFGKIYTSAVMWPRMRALEVLQASGEKGLKENVQQAFVSALEHLRARYGGNWKTWRWGDAHHAPLAHPLWSKVPGISLLTALETEMDGDSTTLLRAAPGDFDHPFEVQHGAGYRAVYDLANPAQSRFIIAGGEGGHPFSSHRGDLKNLWAKGDFITLSGDEKTLKDNGAAVMVLTP